ncbi:hypothetical protein [Glycomyces tarimensis]
MSHRPRGTAVETADDQCGGSGQVDDVVATAASTDDAVEQAPPGKSGALERTVTDTEGSRWETCA